MIGRMLRGKMIDAASESPARERERIDARNAGQQAHTEMLVRFGPLSAANCVDALDWQANRLRELLAKAEA